MRGSMDLRNVTASQPRRPRLEKIQNNFTQTEVDRIPTHIARRKKGKKRYW
jgi:hypothetical protein